MRVRFCDENVRGNGLGVYQERYPLRHEISHAYGDDLEGEHMQHDDTEGERGDGDGRHTELLVPLVIGLGY